MTMIEVTEEDIAATQQIQADAALAKRGFDLTAQCPVALAAKRALGIDVRVLAPDEDSLPGEQQHMVIEQVAGMYSWPLPANVVDAINLFDVEGHMQPLSFEIVGLDFDYE
jgi:hypothetical protein